MKILIIQLARLGDLYLSWPALRALRTKYPQAEISVLTREKFSGALEGLDAINEVIILPVKDIFEPIIRDQIDLVRSHQITKDFILKLKNKNFDQIINLSFSPASSYLTHILAPDAQSEGQGVCGYTRTSDGFLSIPDPMSAYFYAQVGYQKPNRFHLAEIFGTLCGVDLTPANWSAPDLSKVQSLGAYDFLMHIGASENHKNLSAEKWINICAQLRVLHPGVRVALIGSAAEKSTAEKIMSSVSGLKLENLVGQTTLMQTFKLIQESSILVGPDSAPIHMASLLGTTCMNLSIGQVNFWETGPRSSKSIILRGETEDDIASDKIANQMLRLLSGGKTDVGVVRVQEGTPSYLGLFPKDQEFAWKFVQAIYQGTDFPQPVDPKFWDAHTQLLDINQFLLEQLNDLEKGASLEDRAPLIDRAEEVIVALGKIVPAWSPAIRWYQTEKVRIPPGSPREILGKTIEIQNLFQQMLLLYSEMKSLSTEVESEAL